MRKVYTKVQSFPSPESDTSSPLSNQSDQASVPKLENLHQLQGPRISAVRLLKILDASIVSQKMGKELAIEAISPTKGSNSDRKFINCYLDSTALLLEACNSIQLRIESIRRCLDSIPIGLQYLEGENEPNKAMLQQAAIALEASRLRDKRQYSKMKKSMSTLRRFGKKLNENTLAYEAANGGISPDLFKALSGSWAMAVNAVGVLSSATSFKSLNNPSVQSSKVEPRTILLNEMVFQKKIHKIVSMDELASTDLASQTLLKLISAWQKCGSSNLRRMAVKAVTGELRRRKEVLQKALPLLEDKIEEFYQQIVAIRISMFGLIPTTQKEEVLEMVKHSSHEESQMHTNHVQYQRDVARVKVKKRATTQSFSPGQIRLITMSSFTTRVSNQVL